VNGLVIQPQVSRGLERRDLQLWNLRRMKQKEGERERGGTRALAVPHGGRGFYETLRRRGCYPPSMAGKGGPFLCRVLPRARGDWCRVVVC
jgi:hypothetical protein